MAGYLCDLRRPSWSRSRVRVMFDWSEYLGFAQDLIGDTVTQPLGGDAKFRVAVSRAYYAAHWIARQRLETDVGRIPKDRVHDRVIELFKNSGDRTRVKVADDLSRLRRQRVEADYEGNAVIQLSTLIGSPTASSRLCGVCRCRPTGCVRPPGTLQSVEDIAQDRDTSPRPAMKTGTKNSTQTTIMLINTK